MPDMASWAGSSSASSPAHSRLRGARPHTERLHREPGHRCGGRHRGRLDRTGAARARRDGGLPGALAVAFLGAVGVRFVLRAVAD
jgi:hypothetical protein